MVRALTGAVLVVLLLTLAVHAQIQPGFQPAPPPPPTMVTIVVSQQGDGQTHLRLNRSLLKHFNVETPSSRQVGSVFLPQPVGSTVIAGAALSLAFVLSGFWLVRAKPRRVVACTIIVFSGIVAAGLIGCLGDGGSGRTFVTETSTLHSESAGILEGEALLEVDDKADDVQLVIPREVIAEWQEKAATPVDEARPIGGK
jgi:hypothetical protein